MVLALQASLLVGHVTSEKRLLERAKAYDSAALAKLYDQYAPRMYAYIYRRVGDPALAEDLTSELFVRMLRAIQNDRAWRRSFSAWLYRAAHNLVVDHYRRQHPQQPVVLDEMVASADDNPATAVEQSLAAEQLRKALVKLTWDQQQVLALRFGEGLRTRKVAQIMGKTVGAVEALQRRGVAALRRIMEKQDGE